MSWDYAELVPLSPILTGTFESMFGQVTDVLRELTGVLEVEGRAHHGSAAQLPWPDDYFDAVLTDPPYCLAPGTLILTDRGYVPIEHIQVGDRVLSHKGRWAKVTRLYRRPYRGPILRLKVAHCNQPLLITPEHPVRAIAAAPCQYELLAACSPECAYLQQQGRCPHAQFGA
ncbi:MAG: Hint domain-containing protein, partial [Abditibacteriales bacterium]|nr:Hint domain-containing protein [Abditibacteriales bacterium]